MKQAIKDIIEKVIDIAYKKALSVSKKYKMNLFYLPIQL